MKMILGGLWAWVLVLGLSACSSEETGTATLKFALSSASSRVESRADASGFQMKLIAAYLTEDIDASGSNSGQTAMIYLNPTCADDIMHCDVSAGTAEDGSPMAHVITDFFDFTSTSAANTALNAQGLAISAGTYKYARLEFCKYATGTDPNIKWSYATGGVSNATFKQTSCTVNSAVFDPPVTVAAGTSVEITLTYSLAGTVSTGSSGTNCSGGFCFTLPTFTPSAAVVP